MPYYFFLFVVFLLFMGCQNDSESSKSLNVYVETPALYHALSIYQKEVDERPLSIHLRNGLGLFFQVSGTERPVTKTAIEEQDKRGQNIPRLTLGGGLYLSSELPQMAELETYLQKLPKRLATLRQEDGAYPILPQFSSEQAAEYLLPILLYPKLSQITGLPQSVPKPEKVLSPFLYRLLSPAWPASQLLPEAGKLENSVFLQSPAQVLLEYLKDSPLEFRFTPEGFSSNQASLAQSSQGSQSYTEFIRSYRSSLAQLKNNEEEEESIALQPHDAGAAFARLQQKLYEEIPQDLKLAHRDAALRLEPSSFPDLYFTGQVQAEQIQAGQKQKAEAQSDTKQNPNLKLELEKILWGAVNKGLSQEHYQQAIKILTWLQSREGQSILQRELPQLDNDTALGIFRAVSLYPEVSADFWHSLRLDWPWSFAISWVLPAPLVQWQAELFQTLSLEKELLYRSQSAKTIAYDFLLPYLFLPDGAVQSDETQGSETQGDAQNSPKPNNAEQDPDAPEQTIVDWSLWLQAN